MLKTSLCQQLEIEHPIFSVGMGGGMAGPELVAAVSNAGACGVLGMGGLPPPYIQRQIQQLRTMTDKPFGVNIILPVLQEGQIETCLDEEVPILVLFWGDPQPYVAEAHRRGTKVFIQVGSVEEAVGAADAGVDAIIAQGIEAGGHVKSTTSLSTIVPAIVEAVNPVPVIHEFILKEGLPRSLDTPLPRGLEDPLLNRPHRVETGRVALGRRAALALAEEPIAFTGCLPRACRPARRLSADLGLRRWDA